ncbi:hypothetical protein NNJEOMEG_03008 [Fundidesulfovibrio magnetotacticus]|uniref:Uncharacterized protein n=1 Tax=Fundidesulfovibrio magnetotacticus TaxID=2730080 RepID=A0A6V8LW68_9BACT|nr:hypothetical protein [Fundidesulfovibrio magnetotacticus]GFK95150.1 hypothetical protein NNJEOMEG_03008 [Fundidesulfovibrio magnetotacticus]
MRFYLALAALLSLLFQGAPASAEPPLTIVFSGNSWGYLKPCPT